MDSGVTFTANNACSGWIAAETSAMNQEIDHLRDGIGVSEQSLSSIFCLKKSLPLRKHTYNLRLE